MSAPMVSVPITGFPVGNYPINNIAPLTYRDASTFLEILESLSSWMLTVLVPHVDAQTAALVAAWAEEITALTDTVNTAMADNATSVNAALADVDDQLAANLAAVQSQIDYLLTNYIIQDANATALINNVASTTRVALNNLFVNESQVATANGVASLDAGVKIPIAQIPAAAANGVARLDAGAKVPVANLPAGTASGVASLDTGTKVPVAQLPVNVNDGILGLGSTGKAAVTQLPVGTSNGIAGLDATAKVPIAQLPVASINGIAPLDSGARVPVANLPIQVKITEATLPADAGILNSQAVLWLDPTPGAPKLMIRAKNSSGLIISGSVALT